MLELTDYQGYKCTRDGLEIVKAYPDFISSVWLNPAHREFWLKNGGREITKIHHNDIIYIEKSGVDFGEFHKYDRLNDIIESNGYKHIRAAKTFIGGNDRILIEYGGHRLFDPKKDSGNMDIFEEWCDILTTQSHMEFCIQPDGNLIAIDPHV